MAWLNLAMPNQIVKNDLKAKMIKLPQIIFVSRKTTKKIFMYLLSPFILQNSKKTLRAYRELWGCAIFETKIFLVQTIILIFIYLLALFIVQNLQKSLAADLELWGCAIFGPKMVNLPPIYFLENY